MNSKTKRDHHIPIFVLYSETNRYKIWFWSTFSLNQSNIRHLCIEKHFRITRNGGTTRKFARKRKITKSLSSKILCVLFHALGLPRWLYGQNSQKNLNTLPSNCLHPSLRYHFDTKLTTLINMLYIIFKL